MADTEKVERLAERLIAAGPKLGQDEQRVGLALIRWLAAGSPVSDREVRMQAADPLGLVELAVIDAVNRGAFRSRQTADRVPGLRYEPGGDALCTTRCVAANAAGCSQAHAFAPAGGTSSRPRVVRDCVSSGGSMNATSPESSSGSRHVTMIRISRASASSVPQCGCPPSM